MKKKGFRKVLLQVVLAIAFVVLLPMTVSAKVTYEKEQVFYMSAKSNDISSYANINVNCTKASEKIKKSSVKISKATVAEMVAIYRAKQESQVKYFNNYGSDQAQKRYEYQMNLRLLKPGKTKLSFKVGEKKHTITLNVKAYTNPIKKITITGVGNGKNLASKFKYANSCSDLVLPAKVSKAAVNVTANKNWKVKTITFVEVTNMEIHTYSNNGATLKSKASVTVGTLKPGKKYQCSIQLYHKNGGRLDCYFLMQ